MIDDEKFKQLQLNVKFNIIPKTRLKKFGQLLTGYPTGLVKSEPFWCLDQISQSSKRKRIR